MTAYLAESETQAGNPLDLVEQVVLERDWAFDRPGDEELVAEAAGTWCNYRVWCNWNEELGAMLFSCALDTKLPKVLRPKLYPLLSLINEKLWVGHFHIASEDGAVTFRHSLLLRGGMRATSEQMEELFDLAITECDRVYPALQSVIWSGKSPEEALTLAVFDTVGEA